ncbi:hypothetical protein WOLCODRAFT_141391 [Wolfiporia cocos MD-104 SS10]|uniref:Uncharacterized protein n=1 Tax=Wolfiporia cocos (strain MD-104) TaxID=742152 RepID=A0A2H3J1T0_WOLCO|nr:hypothetical protein WOLCODRAFT_141391 [Wolfiporia cocos MD-104 SS10]
MGIHNSGAAEERVQGHPLQGQQMAGGSRMRVFAVLVVERETPTTVEEAVCHLGRAIPVQQIGGPRDEYSILYHQLRLFTWPTMARLYSAYVSWPDTTPVAHWARTEVPFGMA